MLSKYDHVVPLILRLGLAIVFAWFGLQQLFNPSDWIAYVPSFMANRWISLESFILINGWTEVTCALLLCLGFQTRPVALFLCCHLVLIAMHAGGAIGVRDLGLAVACLALAMSTVDRWTIDAKLNVE